MSPHARASTGAFIALMLLTAASYAVAALGFHGAGVAAAVLVTTLLKGQILADRFMGLRRVALRWRAVVSVYLVVVIGLIGLAYGLSAGGGAPAP